MEADRVDGARAMSNAAIMAPARHERLTEEEYLARELRGDERHEFVNGETSSPSAGAVGP